MSRNQHLLRKKLTIKVSEQLSWEQNLNTLDFSSKLDNHLLWIKWEGWGHNRDIQMWTKLTHKVWWYLNKSQLNRYINTALPGFRGLEVAREESFFLVIGFFGVDTSSPPTLESDSTLIQCCCSASCFTCCSARRLLCRRDPRSATGVSISAMSGLGCFLDFDTCAVFLLILFRSVSLFSLEFLLPFCSLAFWSSSCALDLDALPVWGQQSMKDYAINCRNNKKYKVTRFLSLHPALTKKSKEKHVPKLVMAHSLCHIIYFSSFLFDCDRTHTHKYWPVTF